MARRMDRPLVLAHVRPTPTCYAFGYGWPLPAEDPAELLDWLRTELVATIDPVGLAVQFVECMGDTARQLAALGGEKQADAIVLGVPRRWGHRTTRSGPGWVARKAG